MNVTCSGCQTQYKIDETKVPAGGGFIRCKACGDRIRIPAPGQESPSVASESQPIAVPPVVPAASPRTIAVPETPRMEVTASAIAATAPKPPVVIPSRAPRPRPRPSGRSPPPSRAPRPRPRPSRRS